METLRGLLALLCVFLAGTHAQDLQINKFAGKFVEYLSYFLKKVAPLAIRMKSRCMFFFFFECNEPSVKRA